jgi:hypothetical protein
LTGRQYLPTASMVYFDPKSGKYVELRTDSIAVDVLAPRENDKRILSPGNGDGHEGAKGQGIVDMLKRERWLVGFIALMLAVFIVWAARKRRLPSVAPTRELESYPEDGPEPVTQLSLFPATYNLEQAKSYLLIRDTSKFYQEIARVFRAVLAERFGVDALQSRETMMAGMRKTGADESMAKDVADLLEHCQMAIYAPLADPESLEEDYRKAEGLLERMQSVTGKS